MLNRKKTIFRTFSLSNFDSKVFFLKCALDIVIQLLDNLYNIIQNKIKKMILT